MFDDDLMNKLRVAADKVSCLNGSLMSTCSGTRGKRARVSKDTWKRRAVRVDGTVASREVEQVHNGAKEFAGKTGTECHEGVFVCLRLSFDPFSGIR